MTICVPDEPIHAQDGQVLHLTDLPTPDLGPWPPMLSLRREDFSDDAGR